MDKNVQTKIFYISFCFGKGGYRDCGACRSGMWLKIETLGGGHVCVCRLEERGRRELVMMVPGGR